MQVGELDAQLYFRLYNSPLQTSLLGPRAARQFSPHESRPAPRARASLCHAGVGLAQTNGERKESRSQALGRAMTDLAEGILTPSRIRRKKPGNLPGKPNVVSGSSAGRRSRPPSEAAESH